MAKRTFFACLVALLTLGACALETVPGLTGDPVAASSSAPSPVVSASFPSVRSAPPHSSLSATIKRVLPSVVNVKVTSLDASTGQEAKGEGSGVVIDRNGIILTNYHVVAGAVSVRVVFTTGRDPVEGRVIGTEPERDLAVVKVDATDLQPIELGDSDQLQLGDTVVAIGFPLGLGGPTVTAGILSGTERTIDVPREDGTIEHLEGMLQTDAAINPGNSGGALIDAAGRLVGINTAAAGAGSAENIGFSISINSALPVAKEIIAKPAEQRAWLGVIIRALDPSTASELGVDPQQKGALIIQVVGHGPAAEAGLKAGDVITRIDDTDILSADDLTEALAGLDPGTDVQVQVVSKSGSRLVQVTLGQRPLLPEPSPSPKK